MKNKFLLGLCILTIVVFNSVCVTFALDADGSSEGKYIKTEGSKKIVEYPVTAEVKQVQDQKNSIADLHFKFKNGQISMEKYTTELKKIGAGKEILDNAQKVNTFNNASNISNSNVMTASATYNNYEYNYIYNLYQQSQVTSYYCGPATASSIIAAKAHTNYSQYTMASSLRTTYSGTAWYDGGGSTGYPMADTLNRYCNTTWYVPYGTSVSASMLQSHVIMDIDYYYGIAGDAYEVVGGPHLVGHPNSNIFHWFAIDGYTNYGNYIHYADSVAGSSSISWSKNVPYYSSMYYTTLATILDGRGIMW